MDTRFFILFLLVAKRLVGTKSYYLLALAQAARRMLMRLRSGFFKTP